MENFVFLKLKLFKPFSKPPCCIFWRQEGHLKHFRDLFLFATTKCRRLQASTKHRKLQVGDVLTPRLCCPLALRSHSSHSIQSLELDLCVLRCPGIHHSSWRECQPGSNGMEGNVVDVGKSYHLYFTLRPSYDRHRTGHISPMIAQSR